MTKTAKTKKVWFVRHTEGAHNIDDNYDLSDPPLTSIGLKEASDIFKDCALQAALGNDPRERAEVIITSPLTRCIQTSLAAFGKTSIRIIPHGDIQESWAGFRPCDTGVSKTILRQRYGNKLDFSYLEEDWFDIDPKIAEHAETREPALEKRLNRFLTWLGKTSYKRIIVVGHRGIFRRMFPEPEFPTFQNGEVRLYELDFSTAQEIPIWPVNIP